MLPSQPNQSLIDGLACLQALSLCNEPVGSRELARKLGLEPTRANRLLKTLAHLEIARQTPSKKYVAGPGMHVLAAQSIYSSGLIRKSLPYLAPLNQYKLVVAYGVLWKDRVSYFYHTGAGIPVEIALASVGIINATESSIGMLLLSLNSIDSEIRGLYKGQDIPGFPGGIEALLCEVRNIRKKGFAKIMTKPSVTSLAVPVGNPAHSALAFSGTIREADVKRYVDVLSETARKIDQAV